MKIRIAFALVAACAAFGPIKTQADDLFQLFWRGTAYKHAADGHLIAVPFSERGFINTVAKDNNLNPNDLVFVYRPDRRDTAVVFASNGAFVSDVIQFEFNGGGFTEVISPNNKVVVRHALLFIEAQDAPIGSFFGTENRQLNSTGGVSSDSLTGTVYYSIPGIDTVYSAHLSTGRRIRDTSGR